MVIMMIDESVITCEEARAVMVELNNPDTMSKMISVMADLLQIISERNDDTARFMPQDLLVFDNLIKPNISIQSYLEWIFRKADCSPSCFIVAYIYLDRFARKQPSSPINSFSVHRLFLASFRASTKFVDEIPAGNPEFAEIGGINTKLMNELEAEFLFKMGFDFFGTSATFYEYYMDIYKIMIWKFFPIFRELLPLGSSILNLLRPIRSIRTDIKPIGPIFEENESIQHRRFVF